MLPLPLTDIALVMLCHTMLWFGLSRWFRRNDFADVAWGFGFFAIMTYLMVGGRPGSLSWILYSMVIMWAGRLSIHIMFRLLQTMEDFRYREWKESWKGSEFLHSFSKVFLLQSLTALVVSAPLVVTGWSPEVQFGWVHLPGALIWLAGFLIETIADGQLRRYIGLGKPQGPLLRTGLWKYSRHPNYAGEILVWWGFFLMALPLPYGWVSIVSPILMTYILYRVTGVPLLEARFAGNKDYEEYSAITPAILPGFSNVRRWLLQS